jgi:hypothetical protein
MMRFNAVVIASVLLLVGVTGCNQGESNEAVITTPVPPPNKAKKLKAAAPNATATASPAASPAKANTPTATASPAASPAKAKTAAAPAGSAKASAGAQQTLTKLNGYLPAAVKALQANDIAQAKEYAKAFSDNWVKNNEMVRGQVKKKSQDDYKQLTAGVIEVNKTLIQAANPDKAKAIASLQSLSQAVNQYAKSP